MDNYLHCHHDDLVLSEEEVEILLNSKTQEVKESELSDKMKRVYRAFKLWVDTAKPIYEYIYGQNLTGEHEWFPRYPDICKSRLFWWIRSGNKPLVSAPPTAYSCPWYEVVTDDNWHHGDFSLSPEYFEGFVNYSQSLYKIIEKVSDEEYKVQYNDYFFTIKKNPDEYKKWFLIHNTQHDSEYFEENKHKYEDWFWYIKCLNPVKIEKLEEEK